MKALINEKIAKEKVAEIAESMKNLFKNEDGSITEAAIKAYKDNYQFEIDGKVVEISKDLVAYVLPYIEF